MDARSSSKNVGSSLTVVDGAWTAGYVSSASATRLGLEPG